MTDCPESGDQESPEDDGLAFPSIPDMSVSNPEARSASASDSVPNEKTDTGSSSSGQNSETNHSGRRRVRRRMSSEHICRIKRQRRNRRILIATVIVLLALAAVVGVLAFSALKVKNELQQAADGAKGLQSIIADADQSKLESCVTEFSSHIDKAYRQTTSPIWSAATHLPYIGDDTSAIRTTVVALEDISSQALPQLVQASRNINLSKIQVKNSTIGISGLEASQKPLSVADEVIDGAVREIKSAQQPNIRQVADALDSAKTSCAKISNAVHSMSTLAQLLPSMLGTDSHANDAPRNYLILAQTNAEARPSGGLTGSLGVVTVQGGHLSMQPFVSDLQFPKFDESVVELTAEEKMLFADKLGTDIRDANFTPDFPRTGEIVRAMWAKRYGLQVDGVIAIDPLFLQNMLDVTGGVTMPDGSVLDGDTTAQTLLNTVYARMTPEQTDEYFSQAAQLAFDHITQNANNPKDYINALSKSIDQGHLLLWSAHENEQNLIAESNISGRLIRSSSTLKNCPRIYRGW